MIRRRITVLGSTGSVGSSTLDLMDQAEAAGTGAFEVEALTGGANIAKLADQARRWKPKLAVTADVARLDDLRAALAVTDLAVVLTHEARTLRDQQELASGRVVDRLRHGGDDIAW